MQDRWFEFRSLPLSFWGKHNNNKIAFFSIEALPFLGKSIIGTINAGETDLGCAHDKLWD